MFDPLGFVSPFIIQLKILFQDLCLSELDWDSPLSGELLFKWKRIISEPSCLNEVVVPCCNFEFDSPCQTTQYMDFAMLWRELLQQ